MKSKVFEDIFLVSASTLLLLLWSIRYVSSVKGVMLIFKRICWCASEEVKTLVRHKFSAVNHNALQEKMAFRYSIRICES